LIVEIPLLLDLNLQASKTGGHGGFSKKRVKKKPGFQILERQIPPQRPYFPSVTYLETLDAGAQGLGKKKGALERVADPFG
jgi:hypothetical protein